MKKSIHKVSKRMMEWGFLPVAFALVYTVCERASMSTYDAARSYGLFADKMEHILMTFLIVIVGAGIFDMNIRKNQS